MCISITCLYITYFCLATLDEEFLMEAFDGEKKVLFRVMCFTVMMTDALAWESVKISIIDSNKN